MKTPVNPNHRTGWIDAIACIFFVFAAIWAMKVSKLAAAEAIRLYGRNVDSGAYHEMAAHVYLIPAAIILAIAALGMFRGWVWRKVPHYVAWIFVASPFAWFAISEFFRVVAP
jgi:hypothetical protein